MGWRITDNWDHAGLSPLQSTVSISTLQHRAQNTLTRLKTAFHGDDPIIANDNKSCKCKSIPLNYSVVFTSAISTIQTDVYLSEHKKRVRDSHTPDIKHYKFSLNAETGANWPTINHSKIR